MIVYSVGSAKKMLGLSRKQIRKALHANGALHWSWCLCNNGMTSTGIQLCVERHKQVLEDVVETSIFITEKGIQFIKEYHDGTI